MKRKESKNDHINHDDLIDIVHQVEDKHDGSLLEATDEEMKPIWKLTHLEQNQQIGSVVTELEMKIITDYAQKQIHKSYEKSEAIRRVGKSYSWLMHRVYEYRHGRLRVKEVNNV